MNPTIQIIGRMLSTFIFLGGLVLQVSPLQATENIAALFGNDVIRLLTEWQQFIAGFTLASMIVFWFWPMLFHTPDAQAGPIGATFFSPLGRYRLGPINVYEPDGFGNAIGRTINLTSERDKLVKVKSIIPGFLYRAELENPSQLASLLIRRSSLDKHWRVIQFGLAG